MEEIGDFKNSEDCESRENVKKLSCGVLLVARDILKDPNFDTTVVLVCVHCSEGSYGLVLNRPCHMPLSEIFDGFNGSVMKREIYIGGPVNQNELQILQLTDTPVDDAFAVGPRVYLGGKWEGIGHMIETDPLTTRLFLGYSGWAADQLENEILAGAWDIYDNVKLEKLLSNGSKPFPVDPKSILSYLELS
jgi:putative transcriptional regulator